MSKGIATALMVLFFILGIFVGLSRGDDLAKVPGLADVVQAVQLQKSEPKIASLIEDIDKKLTKYSEAVLKKEKEAEQLGFGSGVKVSTDASKTPMHCPTGKEVLAQFENASAWESNGAHWQIQYRQGAAPKSLGFGSANYSVSSRYMSCSYFYQDPEKSNSRRTMYIRLQPKSREVFVAYGNYWRVQKNYASCQSGREACAFLLEEMSPLNDKP